MIRQSISGSDLVLVPGPEQRKLRTNVPIFAYVGTIADEMRASGLWTELTMPRTANDNASLFVRRTCR